MRIACIHIPQFALQSVTRLDPSLRGGAVAVVGSSSPASGRSWVALHSPVVQACSRAAWAMGVRLGMTALAARALSPELRVVTANGRVELETQRAIADALLGVSATVDLGGRVGAAGAHLAIYCEVPIKTRGAAYGDRLLDVLDVLGLTGRIGIADDRFTAWVAAAHGTPRTEEPKPVDRLPGLGLQPDHEGGVVAVPRGGSAAFLAPRPLSLLAITPEVQHMLEALGVGTLGEFASLPAPSIARRPSELADADYQALARGESGQLLRPYAPEAAIREEVVVGAQRCGEMIAVLSRRIAIRLAGRERAAARLEVTVGRDAEGAGERTIPVTLDGIASEAEQLAEAVGPVVMGAVEADGSWRVRVVVTGEAVGGSRSELATTVAALPLATDLERIDALSLVLSTTGSSSNLAAWHLSSPTSTAHEVRGERRETYRRTRRGKQRRRIVPLAQSRLFKNL